LHNSSQCSLSLDLCLQTLSFLCLSCDLSSVLAIGLDLGFGLGLVSGSLG